MKTKQIVVKATLDQKEVLRLAARMHGKSLSSYVLDTAVQSATNVVLDQRVFRVTAEQYEAFMARAEDKERNAAALKRVLEYKASWEKSPGEVS